MQDNGEKATGFVHETLRVLMATSGVMLTLLWGLAPRELTPWGMWFVRYASVSLVACIIFALWDMQAIIRYAIKPRDRAVADELGVRAWFAIAWVTFIIGCGLLVGALFSSN